MGVWRYAVLKHFEVFWNCSLSTNPVLVWEIAVCIYLPQRTVSRICDGLSFLWNGPAGTASPQMVDHSCRLFASGSSVSVQSCCWNPSDSSRFFSKRLRNTSDTATLHQADVSIDTQISRLACDVSSQKAGLCRWGIMNLQLALGQCSPAWPIRLSKLRVDWVGCQDLCWTDTEIDFLWFVLSDQEIRLAFL